MRENYYFNSLIKSAEFCVQAAEILQSLACGNLYNKDAKKKVISGVVKEQRRLCKEIFSSLQTAFITPIERVDIMRIACAFSEILECIEHIALLIYLNTKGSEFSEFSGLVSNACGVTLKFAKELVNIKKSEKFAGFVSEINRLKTRADLLYEKNRILKNTESGEKKYTVFEIYSAYKVCIMKCVAVADILIQAVINNT